MAESVEATWAVKVPKYLSYCECMTLFWHQTLNSLMCSRLWFPPVSYWQLIVSNVSLLLWQQSINYTYSRFDALDNHFGGLKVPMRRLRTLNVSWIGLALWNYQRSHTGNIISCSRNRKYLWALLSGNAFQMLSTSLTWIYWVGSTISGYISDYTISRWITRRSQFVPEDRLRATVIPGLAIPLSLLGAGFSMQLWKSTAGMAVGLLFLFINGVAVNIFAFPDNVLCLYCTFCKIEHMCNCDM